MGRTPQVLAKGNPHHRTMESRAVPYFGDLSGKITKKIDKPIAFVLIQSQILQFDQFDPKSFDDLPTLARKIFKIF